MPAVAWHVAEADPRSADVLTSELGVSATLARILIARGLAEPVQARRFLTPHFAAGIAPSLPGLPEATAVLRAARDDGLPVAVYGDYDVDGVAATTVLRQALAEYGLRGPLADHRGETADSAGWAGLEPGAGVPFHIPDRATDGYGLNPEAVSALADQGIKVLVTVDCGISAHEEIDLANRKGMTVVVTDHHQLPEQLPAAAAIVNPWLASTAGGLRAAGNEGCHPRFADEPCGALVALDLAGYLLGHTREEWLDLVALATVADIVPLLGRNRDLVADRLRTIPLTGNPGLRALLEVSGLAGRDLSARDLAFALAPRINALGRVGSGLGATDAVRAFTTASPAEAAAIARRMDEANRMRQTVESSLTTQSLDLLAAATGGVLDETALPAALVVAGAGEEWNPGIVGIVASRLASRFSRPAAVVTVENGAGRGSARGVPGYNIYQALADCSGLLEHFGGHSQAGGFTVMSGRVEEFRLQFAAAIAAQGPVTRELAVDAVVALTNVDVSLAEEVCRLEPFGHANAQPALAAFGCDVLAARHIGNGRHVAVTLRQAGAVREAVGFGFGDDGLAVCRPLTAVDVVFAPEMNEWNGRRNLRLNLKAVRPAQREAGAR